MERRGRIPVATYRTPEGKTRSRSRVRDPNYNKSDPEPDLFTLLEDNIALREENESLITKSNTCMEAQQVLEKENTELKNRIQNLLGQQDAMKSQLVEINHTLNAFTEEKMSMKSIQQQQADKIKKLSIQLENLKKTENTSTQIQDVNKMLKEEICKLIPTTNANDFESLVETEKDSSHVIDVECIQKLLTEFSQLKTNLNNAELQLYEANEKISELLESQNHLEEENEALRLENTNLTRVAELMTSNMKESVNTSKKMEEALIEMKRRNDELAKQTLDSLDSPSTPTSVNAEVVRLRDEINRRDLAHGERIVEMKKLMDSTIENTSNEEIKLLRLKVEMLEKDLKDAVSRAEKAEHKIQEYENKSQYSSQNKLNSITGSGDIDVGLIEHKISSQATIPSPPSIPPPPPPPMPKMIFPSTITNTNTKVRRNLTDSIASHSLRSEGNSSTENGGCSGGSLRRKQQVEATGLDALVRELKDGNVTLRRARRKTQTNPALKEMFDVLEISRKQNRNSKIFIEKHMTTIDIPIQSDF